MKKVMIGFCLGVFASISAFGQTPASEKTTTYPYWTISKDVQRMQFRGYQMEMPIVKTGNAIFSSKGVHRFATKQEASGTVRMTGMPSYVISKGVARMQYERNQKLFSK
jgi:hypothetical protein